MERPNVLINTVLKNNNSIMPAAAVHSIKQSREKALRLEGLYLTFDLAFGAIFGLK